MASSLHDDMMPPVSGRHLCGHANSERCSAARRIRYLGSLIGEPEGGVAEGGMAGASRTGSTTTTTKSNFSTRSRHPHRISHNWTSNILTQRRRHDVSTTSYSAGDAQAYVQALRDFPNRDLEIATRPSLASQMTVKKVAAPMAVASKIQTRPVATQKMTSADSYEILVAQRKLRPTSPNLGIYKPQITWILSSLNRITGLSVSVPFYLFGLAYLASPLLGWHLDSATLASTFGALPVAAKVGLKALAALPFTFHSWNGIRHLVWDTGRAFNNQTVIRSGWAVVGLTAASTLYLAFAY
ncbi:succinate dehydrogenase cytochrome b subunit [Diplocarpon mali]|nr:succinate dehydrogenase cytochrome b subunit [Diplocarpon mali]